MTSTRRQLPAEWSPQSGVLLTWPHAHGDWRPWLHIVEPTFVDIAAAITQHESVLVACFDADHRQHVANLLSKAGVDLQRVRLYDAPSNDTWARDHGPITVFEKARPRLLDFTFNGWGNKFAAELDNRLTVELHRQGAFGVCDLETVDMVLEGGGIEVDGAGTLLTTRSCLLAPTRNPHLDQAQIEARLFDEFGLARVLWLRNGHLAGDDTDGHIDTLARFCDEQTIAHVSCTPADAEHWPALQAMAEELAAFRTADGAPYRLVPLPLPAPIRDDEGERLPATYANFLIINDAVLVPTYRDAADSIALERLETCFPDRSIVPIDCLALIRQYGSLHCVTMQLPAGVL